MIQSKPLISNPLVPYKMLLATVANKRLKNELEKLVQYIEIVVNKRKLLLLGLLISGFDCITKLTNR